MLLRNAYRLNTNKRGLRKPIEGRFRSSTFFDVNWDESKICHAVFSDNYIIKQLKHIADYIQEKKPGKTASLII